MIEVGEGKPAEPANDQKNSDVTHEQTKEPPKEKVFEGEGLTKSTVVPSGSVVTGSVLGLGNRQKELVISSADKIAFVNSIVENGRFEKSYSLLGGKVNITVRSITAEESQALASWAIRNASANPSDQLAGRYRKYLLTAMVARFNGVDMQPLDEPLFATLEKDGKTVKAPGWVDRSDFWDHQSSGMVQLAIECVSDFDRLYSTLCAKAQDENFWNPDTP